MLFEIFDGGKFLGFEDAEHEEAAILAFANKGRPGMAPFATLAEAREDQGFQHREATAVSAYGSMPTTEPATGAELSQYSRAFELLALADEAKATAERLRAAAGRTTGQEREANIRQAEAAEAEAARLRAELVKLSESPADTDAGPTEAAGAMKRERRHELDILQALRALGYKPEQLPRPPAGTPGPKAEARAALPKMTPKQFDKAWHRLRGFGDIQDAG